MGTPESLTADLVWAPGKLTAVSGVVHSRKSRGSPGVGHSRNLTVVLRVGHSRKSHGSTGIGWALQGGSR